MKFMAGILMLMLVPVTLHAQTGDADPLTAAMASTKDKKFTGSPITLKMKDADIREVLRLISETSGFNIVVSPGVSGKLSVSLEDVPWDQALEVVMTVMKLSAERSDSVLRVVPTDQFLSEKRAALEAEKLISDTAPRITRVFPISYCDLTELSTLLKTFTTAASAPMQGKEGASSPADQSILIDKNTQSIIVRDTAPVVERIRKMISLLDVQTPEVMIDAKVIEATETFRRDISGKFGLSYGSSSISINGGLAGSAGGGTASAGTGANSAQFSIGSTLSLNALLNYSEEENKIRVHTSPRLMVLSGKSARIEQGSNLPVKTTTLINGATVITYDFKPFTTSLDMTPRATNDGSVFLKLRLTRDVVDATVGDIASVAPRNINTEVVVESGNTLVMGGVQNLNESSSSTGFPFLRKIPIIGWMFGSDTDKNIKTELMFFVTPRIINIKKTSIAEGGEEQPKATL